MGNAAARDHVKGGSAADRAAASVRRSPSLLAVHETAEEIVLRPQAEGEAWRQVANDRNQEEHEANRVLADLEGLDVQSEAFLKKLRTFEKSVDEHATAEEQDEFPRVLSA